MCQESAGLRQTDKHKDRRKDGDKPRQQIRNKEFVTGTQRERESNPDGGEGESICLSGPWMSGTAAAYILSDVVALDCKLWSH